MVPVPVSPGVVTGEAVVPAAQSFWIRETRLPAPSWSRSTYSNVREVEVLLICWVCQLGEALRERQQGLEQSHSCQNSSNHSSLAKGTGRAQDLVVQPNPTRGHTRARDSEER